MPKNEILKNKIWDIAVIGAGPAGSTFAREIVKSGLSVVLLDGQSVGLSKPCGGLLAPDAQKLMARYDFVLPKEVLVDPQIFSVKTMDLESRIVRTYQRYYLNMDRRAFDDFLLSLVDPEVRVVQAKAVSIKREKNYFSIKLGKNKPTDFATIRARSLVGADGASSIVRRTFFESPIFKYQAIQEHFITDREEDPYYSCIFDPKTSPSCSWIIRKNDRLIFGGCFNRENSRAAFEEQKERLSAFLGTSFPSPILLESCLAAMPKKRKDFITGNPGIYLIGEAAGFISASSFEGISYAMLSGSLLAKAFLSSTTAGLPDHDQTASAYRNLTRPIKNKLIRKVYKHNVIFNPFLRKWIMKSGITAIKSI